MQYLLYIIIKHAIIFYLFNEKYKNNLTFFVE